MLEPIVADDGQDVKEPPVMRQVEPDLGVGAPVEPAEDGRAERLRRRRLTVAGVKIWPFGFLTSTPYMLL